RAGAQGAQEAHAQGRHLPGNEATGLLRETVGQAQAQAGAGAQAEAQGDETRGQCGGLGSMTLAMLSAPVVGVVLTQVAVLATSIYLHRALAHRALVVHPAADTLFRIVLWLTTGQQRQQWVAVHRKHHAFTDRMGDPHSPRLLGVWRVLLLNAYYYAREARDPEALLVLAWLTAGESLHNNHHAHASSPKFSVRRSEFDPSWVMIRALRALGLVTLVRPPVHLHT